MSMPQALSPAPLTRGTRYTRVAMALHWLIGTLLLGQIAFGFALDQIAPRDTPARAGVINLHKSFGIVLAVLIVLRLVWRLRHRPPAWPTDLPAWQRRAADLGHTALYVCMVVQPTSGYIASNFSKYGVKFFGLALKPWGPELPSVYSVFNLLHIGSAWVFTALIAGHVAMALRHALIDRDGIMSRIWPWAAR